MKSNYGALIAIVLIVVIVSISQNNVSFSTDSVGKGFQVVEQQGRPECSDGVDNDNDGYIDLQDVDCEQNPLGSETPNKIINTGQSGGSRPSQPTTVTYEETFTCPQVTEPSSIPAEIAETYSWYHEGRGEETLVVYNTNHPLSQEMAECYAQHRRVPNEQVCGVPMPQGNFITLDQFLDARHHVIEECLCEFTDTSGCNANNPGPALESSGLTHVAFMRGVPIRITDVPGAGTGGGWERPPFGQFFTYGLKESDFSTAVSIPNPTLAWSHVHAITNQRTADLIERTLSSEYEGPQGTIYARDTGGASWKYFTYPLMMTFGEDIVQGETVRDIPGIGGGSIPRPTNAMAIMAPNEGANRHDAYLGFNNMKNWRNDGAACEPLCRNLDGFAKDQCIAQSTDYFKVLNTECVGTAPGFMSYKTRSYPVQYYGFLAPGWATRNSLGTTADFTNVAKTPVHVREGGAFVNDQFTDDKYLHIGEFEPNLDATCVNQFNQEYPCREIITTFLEASMPAGAATIVFRYRKPETETAPKINVGNRLITLEQGEVSEWQTVTRPIGATGLPFRVYILDSYGVTGFIELDGIEVLDANGNNVLSTELGSFATPFESTKSGDWAANTIDRLNGIAAWGSSSHYGGLGYAFYQTNKWAHVFTNGDLEEGGSLHRRGTLGEAVWSSGSTSGGIMFGDPLYKPFYVDIQQDSSKRPVISTVYGSSAESMLATSWVLEMCPVKTDFSTVYPWTACSDGGWELVASGDSPVVNYLASTTSFDTDVSTLRLTVSRSDRPGEDLTAFTCDQNPYCEPN